MAVEKAEDVKLFDWRLDEPSLAAFGGALNQLAPGMIAVATLAGVYAKPDHTRREIVIDLQALFSAITVYATRSDVNAAVSLANGLRLLEIGNQNPADSVRATPEELVEMFEAKCLVVTSETIRNTLIPTARTIARVTVNRDVIDLRHMVMALLFDAATLSNLIGREVSADALRRLRSEIVSPLETSRERGELIEVWRSLIGKTPAEVEAEVERFRPPPPPPPRRNERIKLQLGDPARVDLLDRKPFADVLGDRINEVYEMQRGARGGRDDQAYIVHLHGPWGSGKSTVLNFLRDRLENGWIKTDQPRWLVVDFNAWKYQRLKPAWWTMMLQIQQAAETRSAQLGPALGIKLHWLWLRFRLGTLSKQMGALAVGLALILGYIWFGEVNAEDTVTKTLVAVAGLISAVFGVANIVKAVIATPDTVAKAQAELTDDPYSEVVSQFEALVARIPWPIIVFIDDLDRCDAHYVGELLDNVQTMLRSAPITYLVAADRAWITTSFSKRYADFTSHSENAARPLGYLFLDKLFQLSVNMPSLSGPVRQRFLNAILGSKDTSAPLSPETLAKATADAEAVVSKLASQVELMAAVDEIEGETQEKQVVRIAVARRLGQTDVVADTEHRLSHLARLIEPNPRSMKNLVSAVAINQSRLVLEGRSFDLDHLARWTIVELRWPLLADWLSQSFERIEGVIESTEADAPFQTAMTKLMQEAEVLAVIKPHLNASILRSLIG